MTFLTQKPFNNPKPSIRLPIALIIAITYTTACPPIAFGQLLGRVINGVAGVGQKKQKKKKKHEVIRGVSIAQSEGTLEKVGAAVKNLANITVENGQLDILLPESYAEANNLKNQISRAISDYGGSSSSSGNQSFYCQMDGRLLSGRLEKKGKSSIVFRENTNMHRTLLVEKDKKEFKIRIYSPGGYQFLFKKLSDGRIFIQEADQDFLFGGTFNSLSDLSIQHSDYVYSRLLPVLKRFGIQPPSSPFDPAVVEVVGNLLIADKTEADRFLTKYESKLSHRRYNEREAAVKDLLKTGSAIVPTLCSIVCDPSKSAEIRFRSLNVIANFKPKFKSVIENVVLKEDLTGDARYLTSLLLILESDKPINLASDQKTKITQGIRKKLQNLINIPVTSKLAVYKKKLLNISGSKTVEIKTIPMKELCEAPGVFGDTKAQLKDLIQFKRDGKHFAFNTDNWKEQYNNETPQDIQKRLFEFMKKEKIPQSHVKISLPHYKMNEESQPMMLFELLKEKFEKKSLSSTNRRYYPYNNRNLHRMEFKGKTIEGFIAMGTETLKIGKSPFLFELKETEGLRRSFQVNLIPKSKMLQVSVYSETENALIRLIQYTDTGKIRFQRILGSKSTSLKADSFEEFIKKHPKLWNDSLGLFLNNLELIGK